jgi:WD40 repeat protein
VAWSPDGTRIVSGSYDRTLKVWDAQTGQEVFCLRGHRDLVTSVAWSADGTRIVSGSSDKTVKVWDAQTGQELLSLKGHTNEVTSVAWSTDGTSIVSGSHDTTVKVWDAQTGQELISLKGHTLPVTSVAWKADGTRIVSASYDTTLKVWEAHKGQEVLSLKRTAGAVSSVAWSAEGKRIGGRDRSGKELTWDATTGQLLPHASPIPMRQQTEAISPDGSRRAFIENGEIRVVCLRDFAEGQKRQQARDRAFLARLARPNPDYHRQRADQYDRSGDLFAVAFHLHRLLLIDPKDVSVRNRLAAVQARLDAQVKAAALPPK